jgi:hypothetical protein
MNGPPSAVALPQAAATADMARNALSSHTRAMLEGRIVPTLLRMAWPNIPGDGRPVRKRADRDLVRFPTGYRCAGWNGAVGGGISSAVARALGAGRRKDADALPRLASHVLTIHRQQASGSPSKQTEIVPYKACGPRSRAELLGSAARLPSGCFAVPRSSGETARACSLVRVGNREATREQLESSSKHQSDSSRSPGIVCTAGAPRCTQVTISNLSARLRLHRGARE